MPETKILEWKVSLLLGPDTTFIRKERVLEFCWKINNDDLPAVLPCSPAVRNTKPVIIYKITCLFKVDVKWYFCNIPVLEYVTKSHKIFNGIHAI